MTRNPLIMIMSSKSSKKTFLYPQSMLFNQALGNRFTSNTPDKVATKCDVP